MFVFSEETTSHTQIVFLLCVFFNTILSTY